MHELQRNKTNKKQLAKLAILNSESYGIPLPTHFSQTQFTLVAMDNFDHSDANSLARISAAHNTAMILLRIKRTSNRRKPLKSEVNLKGISSISLSCQGITEFKVLVLNFYVSDELLSLENVNDKYKDNFVTNVSRNSNLIPGVNARTWAGMS